MNKEEESILFTKIFNAISMPAPKNSKNSKDYWSIEGGEERVLSLPNLAEFLSEFPYFEERVVTETKTIHISGPPVAGDFEEEEREDHPGSSLLHTELDYEIPKVIEEEEEWEVRAANSIMDNKHKEEEEVPTHWQEIEAKLAKTIIAQCKGVKIDGKKYKLTPVEDE